VIIQSRRRSACVVSEVIGAVALSAMTFFIAGCSPKVTFPSNTPAALQNCLGATIDNVHRQTQGWMMDLQIPANPLPSDALRGVIPADRAARFQRILSGGAVSIEYARKYADILIVYELLKPALDAKRLSPNLEMSSDLESAAYTYFDHVKILNAAAERALQGTCTCYAQSSDGPCLEFNNHKNSQVLAEP
jgi:hypothetical protein